jgi:hypothetical protein
MRSEIHSDQCLPKSHNHHDEMLELMLVHHAKHPPDSNCQAADSRHTDMYRGGQSDQGSNQQVIGNLIEGPTLTLREVIVAGRAGLCTGRRDRSLPRCPVWCALECARDPESRLFRSAHGQREPEKQTLY